MVKICSECGAKNFDNAIICIGCGEKLDQKSSKDIDFRSDLSFDKPHKSKIKFVLIAVIIIVILVLASFFILTQVGIIGNDKSKFIGTWTGKGTLGDTYTLTFLSNDTFVWDTYAGGSHYSKSGPYEVNKLTGGKVIQGEIFFHWVNPYGDNELQSFTYYFSNDSKTLTLSETDTTAGYVFTKQ